MTNIENNINNDRLNEELMNSIVQFTSNMNSVIDYAEYLQPVTEKQDTATFLKSSKASAALSGFKEGTQLIEFLEAALNPDNVGKLMSEIVDFDLSDLMGKFKKFDTVLGHFDQFDRSKLDFSQIDFGIKTSTLNGETARGLLEKAGLEFEMLDTSQMTFSDFTSATNRPNKTKLLFQTSLITLISMYESMISDLLRIFYKANNLALPKEKKQLSLNDLISLG